MSDRVVDSQTRQNNSKSRIPWLLVFIIFLVLAAFSRWIDDGDALNPESGVRGWVEISLVLAAFILTVFFYGKILFRRRLSSITTGEILLLLFGLWAAASSFWSPNVVLALGKSFGLLLSIIVASCISYVAYQQKLPLIKSVQAAALLLIGFLFLVNWYYYHEFLHYELINEQSRLVLGYNRPNVSSVYLSLIILCSVYQILYEKGKKFPLMQVLVFLVTSILVVLTLSRTTLMSIVLGIFFLVLFRFPSKKFRLALFTSVVLFGLLPILVLSFMNPSSGIGNFVLGDSDLLTLNGRIPLWQLAIDSLKDSLLIGNGYFSSRYILMDTFPWGINSHNSFLEVFVTTGAIGLFLIALFYLSCLSLFIEKNTFPFPVVYFLVITFESLTGAKLFIPGFTMFLATLFVFYHQYGVSRTLQDNKGDE